MSVASLSSHRATRWSYNQGAKWGVSDFGTLSSHRATRWSYNQGAKWGVSDFGTLSAFDFQPKNADRSFKVAN